MTNGTIFFLIWLAIMPFCFVVLYVRGKKALEIFPKVNTVKIQYQETSASGYSTRSIMTRFGGTSRGLHVIVTENEVWLKCPLLFASILQRHDLLHRIPKRDISELALTGNNVSIEFTSHTGMRTNVVLKLKRPSELLAAVSNKFPVKQLN